MGTRTLWKDAVWLSSNFEMNSNCFLGSALDIASEVLASSASISRLSKLSDKGVSTEPSGM